MMGITHLNRTRLSWCPLAAALLLWGVGCTEVNSASRQETPSAPAVSVIVIQVTPRAIPTYNEYTGTTDAAETAEIRARVDGFVEQRFFEAGQLVKAKQPLYVLDQGIYQAELQRTKAAVAKAEAELRLATETEGVEVLRAESRILGRHAGERR